MEQKMKLIGLAVLILLGGWLIASRQLLINQDPVREETPQPNPIMPRTSLVVGAVEIPVEVRRTEAEMELGLSYRETLDEGAGMAFVYPTPQQVMYWMKGMKIPLDFIWVARGVVVEITEEVMAPTEDNPVPRTVVPAQSVDLVIEVNSGFVREKGIRVGDVVVWQK
jgi:uncharacterized membrane protein (UPF0127 family)